jgi:hypothetical protein
MAKRNSRRRQGKSRGSLPYGNTPEAPCSVTELCYTWWYSRAPATLGVSPGGHVLLRWEPLPPSKGAAAGTSQDCRSLLSGWQEERGRQSSRTS